MADKWKCLLCESTTTEPEKHTFRVPLKDGTTFHFVLCPQHARAKSKPVVVMVEMLTGKKVLSVEDAGTGAALKSTPSTASAGDRSQASGGRKRGRGIGVGSLKE